MNKANKKQKIIAAKLGIHIDHKSFDIAAAQILDAIRPAITKNLKDNSVTQKQIDFAKSLGLDVTNDSRAVASARISDALNENNQKLINEWGLTPGKHVRWKKWKREMVISSIAQNGLLWFKGGNGYCAFPSEIEPI
jgi:hypothetical protein